MKTLFVVMFFSVALNAFAEEQKETVVIPTKDVDVVLTREEGYVSPEQIESGEVKLPGAVIKDGVLHVDLNNQLLHGTDIILRTGDSLTLGNTLGRTLGGDMGNSRRSNPN